MEPSELAPSLPRQRESIASRTRTKVSLVDVEIEELESFLDDDPSYLGLDMEIIEEEENYRRFLTSLLPNVDSTEDDLSFLSEEDDEYQPHEEDEEGDEEEDTIDTDEIPKSELSGLLWDSSNIKLPETNTASTKRIHPATAKMSTFVSIQPGAQLKGSLTPQQIAHLASQMHKHFQLLCQSMILSPSPEAEAMLNDLQKRSESVRLWKESVFRKLRPEATNLASEFPDDKPTASINGRRITRSFSAAHAAVMNPSMYEIHGLQQSLAELSMETLTTHVGAVDYHLTNPAKSEDLKFTASEDRLLVHGVKQCSPKINWLAIQKQFLPMKTQDQLRLRYRFLTSAKAPENPVKDFFVNVLPREKIPWLIEEELRMLRGMASFPEGERNRFAKIAHSHLPHRTRSEIRKKWARMMTEMPKFEINLALSEEEQHAERLKLYLEHKLEEKEAQELVEQEEARERKATTTNAPPECADKHLHPALFFTSWALLHPSYLLDNTCEHNWPWRAKGPPREEIIEKPWTSFLSECDDDEDSEYEQEELASSEDEAKTPVHVEPNLSLNHLHGPNTSEKAKRTLAALERRISGLPSVIQPTDSIELEELDDDGNSYDDDDDFECEELLPSSDEEEKDGGFPEAMIPLSKLELLQKRMSNRTDDQLQNGSPWT